MSKKAKQEQPDYVTELLNKGHVIFRAASRDEFGPMIDRIPASIRYGAGAIGRNSDTGLFSLRIDLVK